MTEAEVQMKIGQLLLTVWNLDKALSETKAELEKLKAAKSE